MDLLAALLLGVLGSMHCIGMCGPLVLSIPSNARSRVKYFFERVFYHSGRALAYAVMGAVLGLVGRNILLSVQQDVSLILGITILLTVAIPLGVKSKFEKYSPLKFIYGFVKLKFSLFMKKRGLMALFVMGMLNGLLPCGLVYTALIGATAVADIWKSSVFMALFGIGTAPALIAVGFAGKLISLKFRSLVSRAIPLLSITLALILILRGMNLGIPMLSPKITHTTVETQPHTNVDCCE